MSLLGLFATRDASGRRAAARALAYLAARRLVAEPDAARAADPPVGFAAGFPAQAVAANLAILRGLCHCRRELAPAGQLPGETRSTASHRAPARPTSAWRCWRTWPPATSAIAASAGCLIDYARRSAPWPAWSATAGTSTTGTTRVRSSRFSRCTSQRWTAATWSAHLLVLRSGLLELIETKVLRPAIFDGSSRHG